MYCETFCSGLSRTALAFRFVLSKLIAARGYAGDPADLAAEARGKICQMERRAKSLDAIELLQAKALAKGEAVQ
jgi:hypothetical protein